MLILINIFFKIFKENVQNWEEDILCYLINNHNDCDINLKDNDNILIILDTIKSILSDSQLQTNISQGIDLWWFIWMFNI